MPLPPTLFSTASLSITLILSTAANGLLRPDDMLTFHLRIIATKTNGTSTTSFQTATFSAEISRASVRVTVPAIVTVSYVFAVRAENKFGSSAYSADSESIYINLPTEGMLMI